MTVLDNSPINSFLSVIFNKLDTILLLNNYYT